MDNRSVLIIDDDPNVIEMLSMALARHQWEVESALDGESGVQLVQHNTYAVAIVDRVMPGIDGLETIRLLKEADSDIQVILHTGYPSIESSIEAIREKVFDYLCKPYDVGAMTRIVDHAARQRALAIENRNLLEQLRLERNSLDRQVRATKKAIEKEVEESGMFLGDSPAVKRIRHLAIQVAPSDMTVLLLGESGVGKNVLAKLIHRWSGRETEAHVKINCPAIPESLFESEVFGHEPGSFTGAVSRKVGLFELGSDGTVVLDEIGDLPLLSQAKLLQVLEDREFLRVGGCKTIEINSRVIAATNAPLDRLVKEGRFRSDLYYRLSEYEIHIPPLRERREDIELLIDYFLYQYSKKYQSGDLTISPEIIKGMNEYDWPGNVRELESLIRRFALAGSEHELERFLAGDGSQGKTQPSSASALPGSVKPCEDGLNAEAKSILAILRATNWNRRKSAEILEMDYSALRRRIAKYGLDKK